MRNPKAAVVLNLPSMEKYEPLIQPGGVLVANASLINRAPERTDITTVYIPANEIAESLGDKRLTNMVALGALLSQLPVLSIPVIEKTLENHLPERHRRLLPVNFRALKQGAEFAQKRLTRP